MTIMTNLYDMSKCTACRGCLIACKDWNQLPAVIEPFTGSYQAHETTNAETFTILKFFEFEDDPNQDVQFRFLKTQCMHCLDPSCMKACPRGCYYISDTGAVLHRTEDCIGCQYCSYACPFGIPQRLPREDIVTKCTMCEDRINEGDGAADTASDYFGEAKSEAFHAAARTPACARNCPTGALVHGPREELLKQAHERVAWLKANGTPNAVVYGDTEGLGKLYVLTDSPDRFGLPVTPQSYKVVNFWQNILQPWAGFLIPLMIAGAGLSFITSRTIAVKVNESKGHGDHSDHDVPVEGGHA